MKLRAQSIMTASGITILITPHRDDYITVGFYKGNNVLNMITEIFLDGDAFSALGQCIANFEGFDK